MPVRSAWKVGRLPIAVAALVIVGTALWAVTSRQMSKESSMTSQHSVAVASGITMEDLARVSRTNVFFGHQSVGMNILDGVRAVYAAHGMAAPLIEEDSTRTSQDGGFIDHAFIGENGNPLLKIQDFGARMRSDIGQQVNVAMMKLCYVDINSGTDVNALFDSYRASTAALQQEFPDVTFIYVTVPLTTEPGLLSKMKGLLTGSSASAADNAARERLNTLIRRQYAGDHLFDLAAIESTAPDGSRVTGTYQGQRYYALYHGYAADYGHLNSEGGQIVATAWLKAIARASGK
jgi:hypothetical protein